jgi:hypothetical protein
MRYAFRLMADQLDALQAHVSASVDALTVAIESGGKPEDVLAAAKTARDAIQAELAAVNALKDAFEKMRATILSTVNFLADLTVTITGLTGVAVSFDDVLHVALPLWNQFAGDVMSRISLFNAVLKTVASDVDLFAQAIPTLSQGFSQIMAQIAAIALPTEAIAALQSLAQGIQAGFSAAISAISASFAALRNAAQAASAARIDELNAEKDAINNAASARIDALNKEREAIQEANRAKLDALNKQLDLAREWSDILKNIKSLQTDISNLLAPTHPTTSLNDVLAQFRKAYADFQAKPTTAGAELIQTLARQLLQLAQQTPGYDLPSAAFQKLVSEIQSVLNAVGVFATAQPSTEAIQQQIADLNKQEVIALAALDAKIQAANDARSAALASIDAKIVAENASLRATLASLSSQEQSAIHDLQVLEAAALEAIRTELAIRLEQLRVQEQLAQDALQKVLGDKSFEEFVADKQAQSLIMLGQINKTLRDYLGGILTGLGFGVPGMASGGYVSARPGGTLVRLGEGGYDEAVIPIRNAGIGRGTSGGKIVFAPQITITGQTADARKLADELESALVEKMRTGSRLRRAVLDMQEGRG